MTTTFGRNRVSAALSIGAFMLTTSFLIPVGAFAKDADTPAMDPNAELTDQKLNPAIAKLLSEAVVSYNAREFRSAVEKIDDARAVPSPTLYDQFQIENLTSTVQFAAKHYSEALNAEEAMAASPALTLAGRKAVYDGCLGLNLLQRNYWRAIQYGRLLERMHLLSADASLIFGQTYYAAELYADSERTAQAAIAVGVTDAETSEKLQKLIRESQEKTGERAQDKGEQVGKALVGGFLGAFASGLTGQNVAPPDMGVRTQDEAKAEAQTEAAAAGQHAAADSLGSDPASERVVYVDLLETSARPSAKEKKTASIYFNAASDAYGKNNYTVAAGNLRKTLDIDPTNSAANYYYADCLARQNGDPIDVVDYLTRAVVFGAGDENATMAKTALQGLATPSAG